MVKSRLALAGLVIAAGLGGCAGMRQDDVTGSLPTDYRQRHPIILREAPRHLDIFASRGASLDARQEADVIAFAGDYRRNGRGGMVAYVGSKHAVIGMTKVAALEGGPQGTRVNAVCPGPIATRMTRDIARQVSPNNPDAVEARYSTTLPIGRYGTAEEVAEVVLFLLSTQSRYVTGTHYVVDGGRMIASSGISAPVVE